jgi:catechol 2,3-dioxygenase-like lactoylglutathione lyase family enzyme
VNVEFLATVAVIAPDPPASRKLYVDALGLPLESHGDDYHHSEQIDGCKSFGIWPLSQAAEACFGTPQWPVARPVPQVSIEFDVVDAAAVGRRHGSSSRLATSCCTHRARSRGVRRWPGCSHQRARSSESRTPPCCTTRTDWRERRLVPRVARSPAFEAPPERLHESRRPALWCRRALRPAELRPATRGNSGLPGSFRRVGADSWTSSGRA